MEANRDTTRDRDRRQSRRNRAHWPQVGAALALGGLVALGAGCETEPEEPLDSEALPLEAVCVSPDAAPPEGAWLCGEDRVVECDASIGSHPDAIWVEPAPPDAEAEPAAICVDDALILNEDGPFPPGEHVVVVSVDAEGEDRVLCESALTVEDTIPPSVTTHPVDLWPPNHDMVTLAPRDCVTVTDRCDADVDVVFTWATSDEPADAEGDGATDSDIALAADAVSLRAERQGGSDGRVYTVGWLASDDAGNVVEGTCRVAVPHDQGQGAEAVDSGAATLVVLADPAAAGPYEVRVHREGDDAVVTTTRGE